jgi:uncharacterized membrane protein YgcG
LGEAKPREKKKITRIKKWVTERNYYHGKNSSGVDMLNHLTYTKEMKRLWISLFSFTLLLLGAPAHASGETITNFKSISSLDTSNVLHVHEKISVDFGGVSHHGIYRDIPVTRRGNEGIFYYTFALVSTSDQVSKSTEGDYIRLRLGDASSTLSGLHDYTVDYSLTPVALAATGHDRVFLNATGDQWEYPILHAEYDLTLPATPQMKPVCYAGVSGSTEQSCSISVTANTITAITSQILEPGSGLSVDANVPSNTFSTYLVANQKPARTAAEISLTYVFYILGLLVVVLTILGFALAIKDKLRKRSQTVVAQYEAPDGLAPAQIGLLSDNKVALQELSATLLDLAVRGYIKISQIRPKTWYRKADYRFDKQKDFIGLKNYEKSLIDIFFVGEDTTVTMSDVTTKMSASSTSSLKIQGINKQIADGLKDAGYYSYIPTSSAGQLIAHSFIFVIWISVFGFNILANNNFSYGSIIVVAIIVIIQVVFLLRRTKLTPAGLEEWAKVEGFKLYLKVAESARIDFSDAPAKTPERFNVLLPYAVALGVEKQWAKQFEGIDLAQSNGWYAGDPSTLGAAVFASSFSSGFSGAMSSGFSGSSGGGSVGGGGGGGGGGGW